MTEFDAYIAVDWSASSSPKQGADSVWVASSEGELENPPTRAEATELVRALLVDAVRNGWRVLVGFDFPYGYPRGFADRVASGDAAAWRRVWDLLARGVEDQDDNVNNRFEVARRLNSSRGAPGPFWGAPAAHADARLPATKPPFPHRRLQEYRLVEQRLRAAGRQPKSPWQLAGAGSVGSQALLGIPRVASLRDDPRLAVDSCVWPFEPPNRPIAHAEIWPGVFDVDATAHRVPDAAQVLSVVRELSRLDRAGDLEALLAAPDPRSLDEEGWILGVR